VGGKYLCIRNLGAVHGLDGVHVLAAPPNGRFSSSSGGGWRDVVGLHLYIENELFHITSIVFSPALPPSLPPSLPPYPGLDHVQWVRDEGSEEGADRGRDDALREGDECRAGGREREGGGREGGREGGRGWMGD